MPRIQEILATTIVTQQLLWGSISKGFAGAPVEQPADTLDLTGVHPREIAPLREKFAEQSVDLFYQATLPRMMRMGKVHPTTEVARSVWCSPNSLPLSDVTVRTGGWAWRRKARWLARLKVAAARSVVFATTTYWVLRSAKTANPASLCCGPRKLSASQSPTGVWPPRPGAVGQYSARCEYTGTCRVDRSGAADPRVAHNAGNPGPSAPPPPEIDRSLRARSTAPVGRGISHLQVSGDLLRRPALDAQAVLHPPAQPALAELRRPAGVLAARDGARLGLMGAVDAVRRLVPLDVARHPLRVRPSARASCAYVRPRARPRARVSRSSMLISLLGITCLLWVVLLTSPSRCCRCVLLLSILESAGLENRARRQNSVPCALREVQSGARAPCCGAGAGKLRLVSRSGNHFRSAAASWS